MIALDTNVIVRLLTNDDPAQVARAKALLEQETLWVGVTVLLECEWVLRAVYRLHRRVIGEAMSRLVALPQVVLEDDTGIERALELYRRGFDFADALHLVAARQCASAFATFDAAMAKRAIAGNAEPSVIVP